MFYADDRTVHGAEERIKYSLGDSQFVLAPHPASEFFFARCLLAALQVILGVLPYLSEGVAWASLGALSEVRAWPRLKQQRARRAIVVCLGRSAKH